MKRVLILFLVILIACNSNNRKAPVSKGFLNQVVVNDSIYRADSLNILTLLNQQMLNHDPGFIDEKYDSLTTLSVDTIIYNSELDQAAITIIVKNSSSKLIIRETSNPWYFDALCFLGKRVDGKWDLVWFSTFNMSRFDESAEASRMIRFRYFNDLATLKDQNNESIYKYNITDKRFWDGPAWKKYFNE